MMPMTRVKRWSASIYPSTLGLDTVSKICGDLHVRRSVRSRSASTVIASSCGSSISVNIGEDKLSGLATSSALTSDAGRTS